MQISIEQFAERRGPWRSGPGEDCQRWRRWWFSAQLSACSRLLGGVLSRPADGVWAGPWQSIECQTLRASRPPPPPSTSSSRGKQSSVSGNEKSEPRPVCKLSIREIVQPGEKESRGGFVVGTDGTRTPAGPSFGTLTLAIDLPSIDHHSLD